MAASEPSPNVHGNWNNEEDSFRYSNQSEDLLSLEAGVTDMNIVHSNCRSHFQKEVEASLESSDNEVVAFALHYQNSQPQSVKSSSTPTSPSIDRQLKRPPGLAASILVPFPIAKPGHSKNTSATSPLLTLTPNSSVDGNEWASLGPRHSPSFAGNEVTSMPLLPSMEQRRQEDEFNEFRSYDVASSISGNDGLRGLEALRDRSNSSPGPGPVLSTSPSVVSVYPRGHIMTHHQRVNSYHSGLSHDYTADRMRPRDRPPLSCSNEGSSNASGIGFVSISTNRSVSSDSNFGSMESIDSRGFGAISRPLDFRQVLSSGEFNDPNRRRSASTGDGIQGNCVVPNGFSDPSFADKFGTLPNLGSHIQHQRMQEGLPRGLQRPRHVRSVSQPMPNNNGTQYLPASGAEMYQNHIPMHADGYSNNRFRQTSNASYHTISPSYAEGGQEQYYSSQQRVSLPNLRSSQGFITQQHAGYSTSHGPPRHELVEYNLSSRNSATAVDEMKSISSMISPSHSPMQVHYATSGSHRRHGSDAGSSAVLSSSPRSISGGSFHGNVIIHHRQFSGGGGDDDLAHPLIGEHIDVPADHDDFFNAYNLAQSTHFHSNSLSMGDLPALRFSGAHHLPTISAVSTAPKIAYNVKFKRTQRNFAPGPRMNRDLKIGTYVKVEADRGEDLGIVVGKIPSDKINNSRSSFSQSTNSGLGGGTSDFKAIIRLATHDEVSLLSLKRDEEEELLKICRLKVRQRGLPMQIVDAEYQFDRHKLTFFFEAEGRVDFRELVRDLFSMYKTRIWMQQLDKSTSTTLSAMISPQPASLQIDYGTPIIAPVSEFSDSIVLGSVATGESV